jgi:hypothetical protein
MASERQASGAPWAYEAGMPQRRRRLPAVWRDETRGGSRRREEGLSLSPTAEAAGLKLDPGRWEGKPARGSAWRLRARPHWVGLNSCKMGHRLPDKVTGGRPSRAGARSEH